jgi:transcriptional regulator with XRE-family HTH domain
VELGLKRAEVAKRADLSYPYISEIENGVKQPSVAALGRIAEALELSVSELAALSEEYSSTREELNLLLPEPPPSESVAMFSSAIAATERDMSAPQSSRTPRRVLSSPPQPSPGPSERVALERLVRETVRDELEQWERKRLPKLVRKEVRRQLEQAMGADE